MEPGSPASPRNAGCRSARCRPESPDRTGVLSFSRSRSEQTHTRSTIVKAWRSSRWMRPRSLQAKGNSLPNGDLPDRSCAARADSTLCMSRISRRVSGRRCSSSANSGMPSTMIVSGRNSRTIARSLGSAGRGMRISTLVRQWTSEPACGSFSRVSAAVRMPPSGVMCSSCGFTDTSRTGPNCAAAVHSGSF